MTELLKYEKDILKAFEKLNKSPRGNQLADINTIISAYLDEGYDNVIIHASTGTGKSTIYPLLHSMKMEKKKH